MEQPRFRRSFAEDHTLGARLFALMESCFPGISRVKEQAAALGAPWEAASTPFVYVQDDLAVTHIGVLEIPLVVMGQAVTVAGIHGVCTHPELRRRGHYRHVMEEVLEYCSDRYRTLMLTTEQPELYEPFGFRVLQEHIFRTPWASAGRADGFRLLDTRDPDDVRLLHGLLATREPVSDIVGVVREKAIFCFNEGSRPLHYADDLDLVVCMETDRTRLRLIDIVAPRMHPLSAVLERMRLPINEVEICFSPDRLDVSAQAVLHVLDQDGPSFLMARGPFAAEGHTFMLPRSARC